jgi:predicted glycosyltransferase
MADPLELELVLELEFVSSADVLRLRSEPVSDISDQDFDGGRKLALLCLAKYRLARTITIHLENIYQNQEGLQYCQNIQCALYYCGFLLHSSYRPIRHQFDTTFDQYDSSEETFRSAAGGRWGSRTIRKSWRIILDDIDVNQQSIVVRSEAMKRKHCLTPLKIRHISYVANYVEEPVRAELLVLVFDRL